VKRKTLIAGGGALTAAVLAAAVVGTSVSSTAALPATNDYAVASGVTATVAQLQAEAEAKAAAEAEARAKAEAEAAAAAKAEAEAAAKAEAAKAKASAPATKPAPATSRPSGGSTNDYGIADSAYTGSYYNAAYESTRKCIVRKESGGNYGIVGSGTYFGAYQFSRSTGDATARMMGRGDLVGTPANQWSRADQDQAFWTLWNNGAGRGHWPTARGC